MSKIRKSAKGESCSLRVHPNCQDGETVVLCHLNSNYRGVGLKSPDAFNVRMKDVVQIKRRKFSSEEYYSSDIEYKPQLLTAVDTFFSSLDTFKKLRKAKARTITGKEIDPVSQAFSDFRNSSFATSIRSVLKDDGMKRLYKDFYLAITRDRRYSKHKKSIESKKNIFDFRK